MNPEDVKIGRRYRVNKKYDEKCRTYSIADGASIIVTAIEDGDLKYDICGENGDVMSSCKCCFEPFMLVPYMLEEATMEAEVEPIYIWTGKKLYMVDNFGRHELTDKLYTSAASDVDLLPKN